MNLRNLFRVSGVILLLFGIPWMLVPNAMPALNGIELDAYGAYFYQILGAYNVATAVLFFLVSGMAPSPARQSVVTFFLVVQVLSGIVSLVAVLSGALPAAAGLTTVATNIIFTLAFGYFRFLRSEPAVTPGLQS
jgi:hypothetical protein